MKRSPKQTIEFRYYDMPVEDYVLPKLGKGWEQEYGVYESHKLHFHNYLEIGFCYHGSGRVVISDQAFRYGDQMFTVIPANIPHTTESDPGHICKWEYLFIDTDSFIRNEMKDCKVPADEIIRIINKQGIFRTVEKCGHLAEIIRHIIEECRAAAPFYEESLKGYLRAFVIDILRLNQAQEEVNNNVRYNDFVEKATGYVNEHYMEDIKVHNIAEFCGLSESHFRRIFEEITNMKPMDYVNMVRIDKACTLLFKEDISMQDLGKAVGYQTASSFNRNFRHLTGMSPLQWRNKEMKNGKNSLREYHISALKGWEVD